MAKGKYHEWLEKDNLLRIEGWARDGLTDEQIAHNMGIAYSTFRIWRKKFSAISAALKKNKEIVDREVENATYEGAKGYFVEETKTTIFENSNGSTKKKTEVIKKWIPPNPALNIFWLKNRKSHVWRDKQVETPDEKEQAIRNWIEATQREKEEGLFDGYEE
jgi:hypothetical protein